MTSKLTTYLLYRGNRVQKGEENLPKAIHQVSGSQARVSPDSMPYLLFSLLEHSSHPKHSSTFGAATWKCYMASNTSPYKARFLQTEIIRKTFNSNLDMLEGV